ncbi:hypothetical protein IWQ49_003906 [Labrenzia sp. EL_126]|nr:hypothetical protein [Labrenzia sp. EL_126]
MEHNDVYASYTWNLASALVWIMWRDADKVREFASVDREQFIKGNIALELDPKARKPYLRFDQAFSELQSEAAYRGLTATAQGFGGYVSFVHEDVWPYLSPCVIDGAVDLYRQRIEISDDRRIVHPDRHVFDDARFPRSEIVERWAELEPGRAALPNVPKRKYRLPSVVNLLARNGKELPGYWLEGTQLQRKAFYLLADMLANEEYVAVGRDRETDEGLWSAIGKEVWRAVADKERGYAVKLRAGLEELRFEATDPFELATVVYIPGNVAPRWEDIHVENFGEGPWDDYVPFDLDESESLAYNLGTVGKDEMAPGSPDSGAPVSNSEGEELKVYRPKPFDGFIEKYREIFEAEGVFGEGHPLFRTKGHVVGELRVYYSEQRKKTGEKPPADPTLYRHVDEIIERFH